MIPYSFTNLLTTPCYNGLALFFWIRGGISGERSSGKLCQLLRDLTNLPLKILDRRLSIFLESLILLVISNEAWINLSKVSSNLMVLFTNGTSGGLLDEFVEFFQFV
jgi:hypothetical protein